MTPINVNVKTAYELKMDALIVESKALLIKHHADEGTARYHLTNLHNIELITNDLTMKDIVMAMCIAQEALYPLKERIKKHLTRRSS